MARRDNFFTQAGRTDQTDPRLIPGADPGQADRYSDSEKLARADAARQALRAQMHAVAAFEELIATVGYREDEQFVATQSFVHRARQDNPGRVLGRLPIVGALQAERKTASNYLTRRTRLISFGECFTDDGSGKTEGYVEFVSQEGITYPRRSMKFPDGPKHDRIGTDGEGDFRMIGVRFYKGLPGATIAAEGRHDDELDAIYASAGIECVDDSSCEQPTLTPSEIAHIAAYEALITGLSPGENPDPNNPTVRYAGNIHFPDPPLTMSSRFIQIAYLASAAQFSTPSDPYVPPTGTPAFTPPIIP